MRSSSKGFVQDKDTHSEGLHMQAQLQKLSGSSSRHRLHNAGCHNFAVRTHKK